MQLKIFSESWFWKISTDFRLNFSKSWSIRTQNVISDIYLSFSSQRGITSNRRMWSRDQWDRSNQISECLLWTGKLLLHWLTVTFDWLEITADWYKTQNKKKGTNQNPDDVISNQLNSKIRHTFKPIPNRFGISIDKTFQISEWLSSWKIFLYYFILRRSKKSNGFLLCSTYVGLYYGNVDHVDEFILFFHT